MSWRLATSLEVLKDELDKKYGDRLADWTIGDQSHAERWSDHNPNANDVVCAMDIREGEDVSETELDRVAEHLRKQIGKHPAIKYVIYERQIAGSWTGGKWRDYNGVNAHLEHIHVSVGVGRDGRSTGPYDSKASWGIASVPRKKPKNGGEGDSTNSKHTRWTTWFRGKPGSRTCKRWDKGNDVKFLQRYIGRKKCGPDDGLFGPKTERGVKWYQAMRGIKVDGIVGPVTWRNLGKRG